jgi:CDP-diacylglycerol--glycerol-3-phosphate 3-phosphatidyltransferase
MSTSTPPRRVSAAERSTLVRNRLIESRLTPNAISLTGLALHVVAAVVLLSEHWFGGGLIFYVGSVYDLLDRRH